MNNRTIYTIVPACMSILIPCLIIGTDTIFAEPTKKSHLTTSSTTAATISNDNFEKLIIAQQHYEKLLERCGDTTSERCADIMYDLAKIYYDIQRDKYVLAFNEYESAMNE